MATEAAVGYTVFVEGKACADAAAENIHWDKACSTRAM
jgi:hypothetical protein